MSRPVGFRLRLGWSGWLTVIIALGLMAAIATFAFLIVVGLFVILLPVALIASLVFYLFPSLRYRWSAARAEPDIVEGEYRVINPRRLERDSASDDRP